MRDCNRGDDQGRFHLHEDVRLHRVHFVLHVSHVLALPAFEGKKEDCSEGHLEMIQAKWVYEWRDNQ